MKSRVTAVAKMMNYTASCKTIGNISPTDFGRKIYSLTTTYSTSLGSIRRSKNTEYMTPPNACPDNINPVTSPFLSLRWDNAARSADYL